MSEPSSRIDRRLLIWAVAAGFVYGLAVRLFFGFRLGEEVFPIMSVAFLFGVPLVLGFLVIAITERREAVRWVLWLVLPWVPASLSLGAALLLGWEGLICIALWLPLFLILSSIGGLLAGVWRRLQRRWLGPRILAGALLIPLIASPLEQLAPLTSHDRSVATSVDIAADPGSIWAEIAEVPTIQPEELGFSWSHAIGFPRPIAASCPQGGVGAIRHATFERGVLFVETITRWQPGHALDFSIRADPVPPETLDRHVTVGGAYFDVLAGSYRIEPLAPGRVRLHLTSRHRLSTHFNAYAGLWTDFIMRDVQVTILRIVARRAELRAQAVLRAPPAPAVPE